MMIFKEKENKTAKIEIRVTEKEKENIKEISKKEKISVSELIKKAINYYLLNKNKRE